MLNSTDAVERSQVLEPELREDGILFPQGLPNT